MIASKDQSDKYNVQDSADLVKDPLCCLSCKWALQITIVFIIILYAGTPKTEDHYYYLMIDDVKAEAYNL